MRVAKVLITYPLKEGMKREKNDFYFAEIGMYPYFGLL